MKTEYKEPKTFIFPEMIARVYIPVLDPKEREKRMKAIHKATANLMEGVTK